MTDSQMAASDLQSLQNSLTRNFRRCLDNPYFLLTDLLSIQFFYSPPTQSVKPPLVTYSSLCSTCVTYRTPCHSISHQAFPIQPLPRKAENFPEGEMHFKHVPLLIYLLYLSPKEVYWWVLFICFSLLEVSVPQSWNLPLTNFGPAFLNVSCVDSLLS